MPRTDPRDVRSERPSDMARRLTAARVRAGLTQGQLARALGTTLRSVQRWELGAAEPRAGRHRAAVLRFLEEHGPRRRRRGR